MAQRNKGSGLRLALRRLCAGVASNTPSFRGKGRLVLLLNRLLTDPHKASSYEDVSVVNGHYKLKLDLRNTHQLFSYWYGEYERELVSVVSRCYRGGVFYDVGASIGAYAVPFGILSRRAGAYVRAFEPEPANVRRLQENLALNEVEACVELEACALGKTEGYTEVMLTDRKTPGNARIVSDGGIRVSSKTLDAVWNLNGHESVGFIKIDTEGWDAEIILGGRSAIRTCRPDMLVEFNRECMTRLGISMMPCWEFLVQDLQYQPYRVTNKGQLVAIDSPEMHQDLLFLYPARNGV